MPKLSFIDSLLRRGKRSIPSDILKSAPVLNIREGEAAIVTYTSAADKMRVLSAFVREGLENGDTVGYIYPDEESEIVRAKLKEHGIDVEKYEGEGSLYLKSLSEFFMSDGRFDKERAIQFWLKLRAKAKEEGYGVREIEDVGNLSFLNGQWQTYIDYWDDPKWGVPPGVGILYESHVRELTVINIIGMSKTQVRDILKAFGGDQVAPTKLIDLIDWNDAFSNSVGLTHQQILSRRFLLEFDPVSNYEKVVDRLAKESMANVEPIFVFTSSTSPIHTYLAKQPTIKFFLTSISTSIPKSTSENKVLLPAKNAPLILDALSKVLENYADANVCFVFDILSELLATIGQEKTFTFLRHALDLLSSEKTTSLFLLNTSAHQTEVVSRLRNLFSNQLTYDKNGLEIGKTS